MKWTAYSLAAAIAVSSSLTSTAAFTPRPSSAFVGRSMNANTAALSFGGSLPHQPSTSLPSLRSSNSALRMSLTVGIVGATGAVGKEIRQCLETRKFPVEALRIFGSARSAGSTVATEYGEVTVELFDVAAARECDVVFLAVSGEFALEHGRAITAGDDGAVCIDNSVGAALFVWLL
jgi:hypothetical protein